MAWDAEEGVFTTSFLKTQPEPNSSGACFLVHLLAVHREEIRRPTGHCSDVLLDHESPLLIPLRVKIHGFAADT